MAADDAVTLWLKSAGRAKLLTASEEIALGQEIQAWLTAAYPSDETVAAGQAARARLVNSNLRLVMTIAKKHQDRGVALEDLLQAGALGLVTGAEKFDPTKGYKFSTYAYWWIRQGMTREISDFSSTTAARIPAGAQDQVRKLRRSIAKFSQAQQRDPNDAELALMRESVGLSPQGWEALQPWLSPSLSLDVQLAHCEEGATRLELLASDTPGPEDEAMEDERRAAVENLLARLPPREKQAVSLRYGIGCQPLETHREIGRALGISGVRASQLLRQALRRIQRMVAPPADQAA